MKIHNNENVRLSESENSCIGIENGASESGRGRAGRLRVARGERQ